MEQQHAHDKRSNLHGGHPRHEPVEACFSFFGFGPCFLAVPFFDFPIIDLPPERFSLWSFCSPFRW